eukprot:s1341_g1.t3
MQDEDLSPASPTALRSQEAVRKELLRQRLRQAGKKQAAAVFHDGAIQGGLAGVVSAAKEARSESPTVGRELSKRSNDSDVSRASSLGYYEDGPSRRGSAASVVSNTGKSLNPGELRKSLRSLRKPALQIQTEVEDAPQRSATRGTVSAPLPLKPEKALASLSIFKNCCESFFYHLAALGEQVLLRGGEYRDLRGPGGQRVTSDSGKLAAAAVVISGTFRVEVNGVATEELNSGQAFGFADVVALGMHSHGGHRVPTPGIVSLRATTKDMGPPNSVRLPCCCFLLRAGAVRRAVQEMPAEQARLEPLMEILSHKGKSNDFLKPLMTALQCGEAARPHVLHSSTRHLFCEGELIVTQGKRKFEGLVLVRRGSVSMQINGVEVRRFSTSQVVGEEMLMNVSGKWRYSLVCLSLCDIVILHRKAFLASVKNLKSPSSSEDGQECQHLLSLLEGQWKEELIIVSLPLFHGFDSKFLSLLPQLMEMRVVLPENEIWSSTSQEECPECSLFLLLRGTAEEIMAKGGSVALHSCCGEVRSEELLTIQRKRRASAELQRRGSVNGEFQVKTVRRTIIQGACEGATHMLALPQEGERKFVASTVCVAAVLHRKVFLHMLHTQNLPIQATEVLELLEEVMDKNEPLPDHPLPTFEMLETCLPLLRGLDEAFMSSLLRGGIRRFYMEGQQICPPKCRSEACFVVLRGEVCIRMAGVTLDTYRHGQALHILALSSGPFIPAYETLCVRVSEVWVLPRTVLMTSLDHYPAMKRILGLLTAMPVAKLTGQTETQDDDTTVPTTAEPSPLTSPRANQGLRGLLGSKARLKALEEDPNSPVDLAQLSVFSGLSSDFIHWIQENLEPRIVFSDDTLFGKGEKTENLYIVCKGSICLEKKQPETFSRGSCFGHSHLLGVSEGAVATAVSLEMSLVQVLSRQVLLRGLAQFPSEAEHFDNLTVNYLESQVDNVLHHAPAFADCCEEFRKKVSSLMRTRLLRTDECLVKKGAKRGSLFVVRTGIAVVDEESPPVAKPSDDDASELSGSTAKTRRLLQWEVVNADVVLGLAAKAPVTVKAAGLMAVAEIEDEHFIGVLRNFPLEVPKIIQSLEGTLWPEEAEQVPSFLNNMSQSYFSQLTQEAEWRMFLPDRNVVRQGMEGNALFLLCYGRAICAVDDVVLGQPLARGEVVGRANFLGLKPRYGVSVKAQTVCHFRVITHEQLLELLTSQLALREWFELAKLQVRHFTEYDHERQKVEVFRAKLRRRTDRAWRKHVEDARAARAARMAGRGLAAPVVTEATEKEDQDAHRRSDTLTSHGAGHGDRKDSFTLDAVPPRPMPTAGSLSLQIPSEPEDVEFDLASVLSGFSGSDDEAEEADARSLWRSHHNALPKPGKPGLGKHGSIRVLQKRLPGKGSWKFSKGNTGIKAAIHEFCREKEKDRLKGRLLRIMRNDYTTGEATLDDDDDSEESEEFE